MDVLIALVSQRAAAAAVDDIPGDLRRMLGLDGPGATVGLDWALLEGRLALRIGLGRRLPLVTSIQVELVDGVYDLAAPAA